MASLPLIAGGSLLLKGLSSLFGHKAKKKQQQAQNVANTNALNIAQKRGEDERRARLSAANSLLGGVPTTTAGGAVNTNVALDPELVKQLGVERTYNFGSTMPEAGAGGFSDFLAGLFGGAADTLPYMVGQNQQPAAGSGTGSAGPPATVTLDDLKRYGRTGYAGGQGGQPTAPLAPNEL